MPLINSYQEAIYWEALNELSEIMANQKLHFTNWEDRLDELVISYHKKLTKEQMVKLRNQTEVYKNRIRYNGSNRGCK